MKLKWLKDKLGEKFYPIAHATGVVVAENKTLDTKLTEIDKDIEKNGYGEVAGGKNLANFSKLGMKTSNGITFEYQSNGSIKVSGTVSKDDGVYTPLKLTKTRLFKGHWYTASVKSSNPKSIAKLFFTGKGSLTTLQMSETADMYYYIQFFDGAEGKIPVGTVIDEVLYPQLEEGKVVTEYEPYFPSNKMLAEENSKQSTEMMDIKMLGWSVPRECPAQNEVNGNQFIQKVGRVDSSALDWSYQTENTRFIASIPSDMKQTAGTRVANIMYLYGYKTISDGSDIGSISNKSIYISNNMLVIHDSAYTDASAFKSAMQGQYLYYDLATPITKTIDGNEIGETVSDLMGDMYFEKEISLSKAQLIRNGSYSDINIISSLFLFGANGKFGLSRGYISLSLPASFSKKDEIYIKLPYKQYGYKKDNLLPYIYKTVFCTQGDFNGKIIGTCNLSYYSGSEDEGISLTIDINDNYSFTDDNMSSAYVNLRF